MELKMTLKEADRYSKMKEVESKKLSLIRASKELMLSYRQAARILFRYRREGPKGVVSKSRGNLSNNRLEEEKMSKAIYLIKKKYIDYGPTLVSEKLYEKHKLKISRETLRKLMISEGIWIPKKIKERKVYARRTRRSRYGDLEQIDGSYHHWFEDRGEKSCLLVSVDDATSAITGLRFCKHETTDDYLEFLKGYIKSHGKPMAFYSDKHSTFRVNNNKKREISYTQLHQAMKRLDIELIYAHSPQAKGRVERANGTLQDRLVKELREKNISSIKEANKYLETFRKKYNEKFAIEPAILEDSHREILPSQDIEKICMIRSYRKLSKDLSFQYKTEIYQIDSNYTYRLYGKPVEVCEMHGEVKMVLQNGKELKYKKWIEKRMEDSPILGAKELEARWPTYGRKPKRYHPWK